MGDPADRNDTPAGNIGPHQDDGAITLRPMAVSDVEDHLAGDDPHSVRWLNDGQPSERTGTTDWVLHNRRSWATGGPVRAFAVTDHRTGQLLGTAEANLDWRGTGLERGEVNLSYQVYPHARGRGVAARAVTLLVAYLHTLPGTRRAVALIDPANVASQRVAHTAGLTYDGTSGGAQEPPMLRYSTALRPGPSKGGR